MGGQPPVPGGQVGGGQGEIITDMARMMVNGTLRLGGRLIKTFKLQQHATFRRQQMGVKFRRDIRQALFVGIEGLMQRLLQRRWL